MAWYDIFTPGAKMAWEWGKKRDNVPQIDQNPYMGNWNSLIGQLEQQASGKGPSLAGDAYKQAHQTGMNNLMAMSRGGSAGGTRMAGRQMGQMNQGLSQGYANARLAEQLAARQALSQSLMGAGNAWFQPQQANLQATMATPTNMQMLTKMLSEGGGAAAKLSGGA
jgi:hypothetical protein